MTITKYLDTNGNIIKGLLRLSTAARGSGSEDGNIYFNYDDWTIELISYEDGLHEIEDEDGATITNPLNDYDGITFRALYGFYRYWVRHNETLRTYKEMIVGKYIGTGAYKLLNDIKFSTNGNIPDYRKMKLSGWDELDENEIVQKIYSGITSIANIEVGTQCQYQLVDENDAINNFIRTGPIAEPLVVYDNGNFDKRGYIKILNRRWGAIHNEADLTKMGVTSLIGQNNNTALSDQSHPTTGQYNEADVYGGSAKSPWTGMSLERYDTPQKRSGFDPDTSAEFDFTWILHNNDGGNLAQCIAYLDACARASDDIDSGDTVTAIGIKCGLWYELRNGIYYTKSGLDGGLHIDNLPATDKNNIRQIDNSGSIHAYPMLAPVEITVLDVQTKQAIKDARVYLAKDSDGTVLMNDITNNDGKVSFGYNYDQDTNVNGRVRKSTQCTDGCPLYKTSIIGGTIKTNGMQQTVYLISDE